MAPHQDLLVLAFGLLGNVVSFLVYLAPLPTFYTILKKKSTEGFQSIPYCVALFSAMLTLYYATLKHNNALMLITINSIGCVIEGIYVILYLIYATRSSRIYTFKILAVFNTTAYLLIVLVTKFSFHGDLRMHVVGWICAVFSVCVFAAPLSIMRLVIRTKSVEYMPFSLSFFLTLCAVCWLGYGLAIKDYYVASPNILGFAFGIAQMILYMLYRNRKNEILPEISPKEIQLKEEKATENGTLSQPAISIDISKSVENLNV